MCVVSELLCFSLQDTQPSPLALLAATCSKIGPPAAQAPVTSPPAQPQPRRLLPIKPAPIAPAPPKNLGFLSTKGNVIQLPAGLGSTNPGSPIVLTIQQSPARTNTSAPANIQYQVVPQIQGAQTIQVMPQGGQIQLIPGTNQAIITTPMTVPAPAAATTPVTPQKTVAIKPSPKLRKPNNSTANMVQLPSGLTLPLNVATGEVGGTQIITETAAAPPIPGKGRRGRKKKAVLAVQPQPPPPPQAASPPPEQMETILIEAGDNIIQVHLAAAASNRIHTFCDNPLAHRVEQPELVCVKLCEVSGAVVTDVSGRDTRVYLYGYANTSLDLKTSVTK